jgi:Cu-Zn family superoxide dismutase
MNTCLQLNVQRSILFCLAVTLAGCAGVPADAPRADATLMATRNQQVTGSVSFIQIGDKVRVDARVSGLKPGASHGFHVHEVGDCSSGDGMSTKGHFNPFAKPHAHHATTERHAGDLPMLVADATGLATLQVDLDVVTVTSGPASIVGRGLIVHADPDDFKTQPTGNSGARLACAVIQRR